MNDGCLCISSHPTWVSTAVKTLSSVRIHCYLPWECSVELSWSSLVIIQYCRFFFLYCDFISVLSEVKRQRQSCVTGIIFFQQKTVASLESRHGEAPKSYRQPTHYRSLKKKTTTTKRILSSVQYLNVLNPSPEHYCRSGISSFRHALPTLCLQTRKPRYNIKPY